MVWESESSNSKMAEFQEYMKLIEDRLSVGAEKTDVTKQLVEMGLKPGEASGLVEKVARRLDSDSAPKNLSIAARARGETTHARESTASTSKVKVMIAALAAALIGGYLWNVIGIVTGYEIGYVAWGIGFLVGTVVMNIADGDDNIVVPLISAGAALVGVFFGKYLLFIHFYNEFVVELQQEASAETLEGAELVMEFASVGVFSAWPIFAELGLEFGMYEFLWVFLAASTAWGLAIYD